MFIILQTVNQKTEYQKTYFINDIKPAHRRRLVFKIWNKCAILMESCWLFPPSIGIRLTPFRKFCPKSRAKWIMILWCSLSLHTRPRVTKSINIKNESFLTWEMTCPSTTNSKLFCFSLCSFLFYLLNVDITRQNRPIFGGRSGWVRSSHLR